MTEAPENPTTHELRERYGLRPEAELAVIQAAAEVSTALYNHEQELVAIIGGCSMTGHQERIEAEGRRIAAIEDGRPDLHTVHRIPPWKPRTKPDSWHGEETTNPEGAYRTLASLAAEQTNVAIELDSRAHIDRYGPMLTFAWFGARKTDDPDGVDIVEFVATKDPKLPIGVKNGLDGDTASIKAAYERAKLVDAIRAHNDEPARAVVIYRGGRKVQTPEQWEEAYLRALEITEGKLIVDTAHGSEMAHDPDKGFAKSVAGQIAAMEAVIRLAERGHIPAGIMIEASDIASPVDPVMPLETALEGVRRLYEIKTRGQNPSATEKVAA